MFRNHARRLSVSFLAALAVPLLLGCGSGDSPTEPDGEGGDQTASATATPSSGSVATGEKVTTTIVFSATGGLTIGSSYTINRPLTGITVDQVSSETSGSTITKVYEIEVDATVPPGSYAINFSTPVHGYLAGGSGPTHVNATFTLTVTP